MLLLIVIVAALIVAGTWVSVWLLALSMWIGISVTMVAIVAVSGFIVLRRMRAVARAAALERELLRQASEHAEKARPERRAEILALQAHMKEAIETLKRSKLGARSGKAALYALPWYVVVGPPAAGKTTALQQSGLAFTSGLPNAPKIKGTAGTRNCDWWFSKEAILLDTAGRFATDDEDREEWLAFLETIKRFRAERPIDGVVVAVSAVELVGQNAAQIDELAEKLRARVDEVMARLEMIIPVYVMVTKVDLIAGFVEFWGDLGKQQRKEPWGTTFLLDDERLTEPVLLCEAEFDLLIKTLHARMIERLAREPMPEVRARILQFPVEFQSLRSPLAQFVEQICRANPYQETPLLRGFYFTSGIQIGRPIDRVLSNMTRGFDLGLLPADGQRGTSQSVSYFVTDLFRSIIFPDRHLAVRSSGRLRRHARRQIAYAAAALFFTMMALLPATISYFNNLDLVRATARDVEELVGSERGKPRTAAAASEALGLLVERVRSLEEAKARFRIPFWWGLSSAGRLYEPVQALYTKRLREIVEGPVEKQIKDDVRAIADSVRTDAGNFQSAYDGLKLYLMLAAPEHLDVEWASQHLATKWARALRSEATLLPETLVLHARRYVDALSADKSWVWHAEESLVGRARDRLSRLQLDELQYGWLVGSAEGVASIRPRDIFYGASEPFVEVGSRDVQVAGIYTAAGWEKIRAALESTDARFVIEPWVIGAATPSWGDAQKAGTEKLRETYFQRYVRAWSDFLSGLTVKTPADIRTAIEELTAISELDGPYTRLFQAVSQNVRLDVEPRDLSEKLLEKGKDLAAGAIDKLTGKDAGPPGDRRISPVERHFKYLLHFAFGDSRPKGDAAPSGLSVYLANVKSLAVALDQLAKTKEEPGDDFHDELRRTAAAVEKQLVDLDRTTRQLLEPFLMNPIRGSRGSVASSSHAFLDDKWKAEVWEIWNDKLAGRYPFAEVPQEATLAEFADFFRPQAGVFWKFYDKNLSDRVERAGNAFSPKPSAEPVPFRADFLSCLGHAQEITDAVFGTAADPSVPFEIKMHSVGQNISEVTFRVDGQPTVYRNEPERWLRTQWPGKAGPHEAVLQVKGAGFTDEIPRRGDFGLFRLLTAGAIKPAGEGILVATWGLNRSGEPPVTIEFKPSKSMHPFARDFFRRLKCPPEVTQSGGKAPGGKRP